MTGRAGSAGGSPDRVGWQTGGARLGRHRVLKALVNLGIVAAAGNLFAPPAEAEGRCEKEAVDLIRQQCQPMIQAVRRGGGQFLYRGSVGPQDGDCPFQRVNEVPDLLDETTYGKQGASYFALMEKWLIGRKSPIRPSNAHIGVADAREAGLWGQACSCWPVGHFDYLWLEESRLIYDSRWEQRQPLWSDAQTVNFISEETRINSKMENGLSKQHEIMFRAEVYWLVPAAYDVLLRKALHL
eukprot:CAMPEP_0184315300 /NCGR_PEP_ID=MMETSP1049-20130417/81228_1 /TAXON_ID=77928 /ORGANISM="Proteomonas sulcata, Strain CCMP704" /LENGTH=240 /DNA_ID=CAMNT_0026633685 /DNA_START=36 /DNA_END=758 /DNA_ORIENTATION=+